MSPRRKGERNPKPKPRSKAVCSFLNPDVDMLRKEVKEEAVSVEGSWSSLSETRWTAQDRLEKLEWHVTFDECCNNFT